MKMMIMICALLVVEKEILFYRELLHQSAKSELVTHMYYNKIKKSESKNPVIIGYKAMAAFLMSRYESNPFTRMTYFKEGKSRMEEATKMDSTSIELIYLRFSVQSNVPGFLKYNSNMVSDRKKILAYLKNKTIDDKDLHTRILNFISQSKQFSDTEKKNIKMNSAY